MGQEEREEGEITTSEEEDPSEDEDPSEEEDPSEDDDQGVDREDKTLPTSEGEDQLAIQECLGSNRNELGMPLQANKSQLEMERRLQCLEYHETEEATHLASMSSNRKRKMEMMDNVGWNSRVDFFSTMKQALEIQENLDPDFPSFLKFMLRSHVTVGFWLPIPSSFCKDYLPNHDEIILLEDETGKSYETKYLADASLLSGGWRRFSMRHYLREGDAVVFQLVHFCKFKVYIVRASHSREIGGALVKLDLPEEADPQVVHDEKDDVRYAEEKSHPFYIGDSGQRESWTKVNSNVRNATNESEKCEEDFPSKDTGDAGFQPSFIKFQEFNITIDGITLDSMLTEEVRRKYYELCLSQGSYLHDQLKSMNYILASGIILETTIIADGIRGCKLSTSIDDFATWDKTLVGFEVLGMNVGFLRSRLGHLVSLATKIREIPELERYKETKLELDSMDEEIQALKSKLQKIEGARKMLVMDMNVLKGSIHRQQLLFKEAANSPWSYALRP